MQRPTTRPPVQPETKRSRRGASVGIRAGGALRVLVFKTDLPPQAPDNPTICNQNSMTDYCDARRKMAQRRLAGGPAVSCDRRDSGGQPVFVILLRIDSERELHAGE